MSRLVFQDFGGIDQLLLQSPDDLPQIAEIERPRWAATSVPCSQLFCDPAVLAYLDEDDNGRLRVDELLAAQQWLWARLRDRSQLDKTTESLALAAIDADHAEGKKLSVLARRLLDTLGDGKATSITLAQVRSFRASYAQKFPNGDGVVVPAQATDAEVTAFAERVVAATGGADDLSGAKGVGAAQLGAWQDAARAFITWKARVEGDDAATVLPFGADTAGLAALVQELAPKVAQFFAQCALLRQEAGAATRLQATQEDLAALDVTDPAAIDAWLGRSPIAQPAADGILRLDGPLNPKFADRLKRLRADVLPKALGLEAAATELTETGWAATLALVQPFLAWRADRPASIPEDSDPAELQAVLDGPAGGKLKALIDEDQGVADELQQFNNLEKLVLYQRWLFPIANNVVSFPELFDPEKISLFQTGTLVIDGRALKLCVKVDDRAAHKKLATESLMFIAYLDLVRKDAAGGDVKGSIAAALTSGTRGGVAVGKRGVFYDRDNHEWDAIVVDVIDNPISIWEAMIAPFQRMQAIVAERFQSFVNSKAAAAEGDAAAIAKGDAKVPGADAAKPADTGSNMQGLILTGSVAFAAVGTTLTYLVSTLSSLSVVDVVTGIGTVVIAIMAIFGFLGWLKLRRRDISALLEACAWALNGRMRLSREQALLFTNRPKVPTGSEVRAAPGAWRVYAFVAAVVVIALGIGYYFYKNPEALEALKAPPPAAAPADAATTVPEAAPQ